VNIQHWKFVPVTTNDVTDGRTDGQTDADTSNASDYLKWNESMAYKDKCHTKHSNRIQTFLLPTLY